MQFGIIGSGICGLTTALELQNEYPNAKVRILADKFNKDTTSYVAAGIFRVGTSFSGPNLEITRKWISDSYSHWDELRLKPYSPKVGVCSVSGYIFSNNSRSATKNHFMEELVPIYRDAAEDELELCGGGWKYGSFFTTLLIESGLYLPYAAEKFTENGGEILEHHVENLNELQNKYDMIFNCSGLGARKLCGDYKLTPIRGQVIKVRAPWIKMAFYGDIDTYIVPGFEGIVTLGGTRQYESNNLNVCKYDSAAIWDRCCNMLPSLKNAEILRTSVGLRPFRDPVRVETEILSTSAGTLKIIHNYGHGGYGVLSAPGTAKFAVSLVRDFCSQRAKL